MYRCIALKKKFQVLCYYFSWECAIFIQKYSIMLKHMPQLPSLAFGSLTLPCRWFWVDYNKRGFWGKWNKKLKIVLNASKKEKIHYCLFAPSPFIVVYLNKKKLLFSSFSLILIQTDSLYIFPLTWRNE